MIAGWAAFNVRYWRYLMGAYWGVWIGNILTGWKPVGWILQGIVGVTWIGGLVCDMWVTHRKLKDINHRIKKVEEQIAEHTLALERAEQDRLDWTKLEDLDHEVEVYMRDHPADS
jgi:hypothetical protein